MHQLIRYRALAAELSPNELKAFCSKLIDDGEQELLISGIFNNLYKQIKHNKDMSKIQKINKSIVEITQQRNVSNTSNDLKPTTMSRLSSSSINEIGSYLWLDEIVKMERVNRRFFVALRYPYPALQQIRPYRTRKQKGTNHSWSWMPAYCKAQTKHQMPLDFQQFRSLRSINIDPMQIVKYKIDTLGRIFNKIDSMTIHLQENKHNVKILQSNICNFPSIKTLNITALKNAAPLNMCSYPTYFAFLGISEQINDLIIHNIKCTDKVAAIVNKMSMESTPNKLLQLEAFRCSNTRLELYKPLLNKTSSQIYSLHIDDPNALINVKCDPNYIGFPKVKEFCFKGTRPNVCIAINELIKSVTNLKSVAITFINDTYRMNNLEKKNFSEAMYSILSINTLERIILNVTLNVAVESEIIKIVGKAIMGSNINGEKPLTISVIGVRKLSSEALLEFIKTMKIWRNRFEVHIGWIKPLTGTIVSQATAETLSKIATIKYSTTDLMFYVSAYTFSNKSNIYKRKISCNFCVSYL